MDDKLSITDYKDYISDLKLDIKSKMELINFISSLKSEIINNLESKIQKEVDDNVTLLSTFLEKKDHKTINNITSDILFFKRVKEFFNNQK